MFEQLEIETEGSLAYVWLNRPEKLNALSKQLLRELAEAAHWLNTQTHLRAVVIGGRGKVFCAGADLSSFVGLQDDNAREAADLGRVMADAIESINVPTIARLHGWCVGGGLVLAAACDLRVASQNTRFSIPEVDLGIPLAWGGVHRLVREIGPCLTKELVMTCREFDTTEAKAAGFLNRTTDNSIEALDQGIADLTKTLCNKAKLPLLATKRHVNAVSSQMVNLSSSWSDADSLLAASLDEECSELRESYIKLIQNK